MHTHGSDDTASSIWRTALVALLAAAPLAEFASIAHAQDPAPRAPAPLVAPPETRSPSSMRLSIVPQSAPRPAEGAAPEQQWPAPGGQRLAPTASFVEPLKGNDAVIEVVLGQGRLLTLKSDIAGKRGLAVIAIGDPSVIDFEVLPNPRLLRLTGRRAGITDLSITTADGQAFSFEVRVLYDLDLFQAQLRSVFPDAQIRLTQIREHLVVEGKTRSEMQAKSIVQTVKAYLTSMQVDSSTQGTQGQSPADGQGPRPGHNAPAPDAQRQAAGPKEPPAADGERQAAPETGTRPSISVKLPKAQVINLLWWDQAAGENLERLSLLLRQAFPDCRVELSRVEGAVVVAGEVRSIQQVAQVLQTVDAHLAAVYASAAGENPSGQETPESENQAQMSMRGEGTATLKLGRSDTTAAQPAKPQIINLLRVPGVHQVMLQVRIAELNRTSLREIGANLFYKDSAGRVLGSKIGGAGVPTLTPTLSGLLLGGSETAFGIFPSTTLDVMLRALRENNVVSILAEPNLVAMSGQHADFLAGGEFPVPVPQNSGGGTTITIEFKKFGVQLDFVPYVLEDETIRLTVRPEESSIDFTLGTELNGYRIPGLNTRRASTTVELRQGQTLGIAGLLRMTIEGRTRRIPGLGDLPYIGPMFSNTSSQRTEKELLVLVTPHLVAPMNADQVPPLPGAEINEPNDLEFYLLNRIEGRTGRPFDSTRSWNDPWDLVRRMRLEQRCVCGPAGFSPSE